MLCFIKFYSSEMFSFKKFNPFDLFRMLKDEKLKHQSNNNIFFSI